MLRSARRPALIAAAFGAALLALGVATARARDPALYPAAANETATPVYVVHNHFHAGLTVPAAGLKARGGPLAQAVGVLPPSDWVSLGWGDAKFYQAEGIDPARALDFLRAMLAPGNPSVMHLAAVGDPRRDRDHPGVLLLYLSRAGLARLEAGVDASFQTRNGRPVLVAHGAGWMDSFYRGRGDASMLHECNQWVAARLGDAGVPHTPVLDESSDGLALDLVRRAHAQKVEPKP